MIGKAVKLAEGYLDTHSKKVVMNRDFIAGIAKSAACSDKVIEKIGQINMAREIWDLILDKNDAFYQKLLQKCKDVCQPVLTNTPLEVLLMDNSGVIIELKEK